jgi:hypothetical protein
MRASIQPKRFDEDRRDAVGDSPDDADRDDPRRPDRALAHALDEERRRREAEHRIELQRRVCGTTGSPAETPRKSRLRQILKV